MFKKHHATECFSFETALSRLPETQAHLEKILARLNRITPLPQDPTILDIGAAQGLLLICCARKHLRAVGVEPWEQARQVAERLAAHEGSEINLLPGAAEALPVPEEQFDIVHARHVVEHANNAQAAFNEAYRVLKQGGVFWFSTASSICPHQHEIARFPCFGWYPLRLKRRIMQWAKVHKPHLVGHTSSPAVNWFTPWKIRKMLRKAGFQRVYGRWDLRLPSEGGRLHGLALRTIQLCAVTKLLADMLLPDCSFAALK